MKNTQIILGGILVIALLFSVGTVAALDDNSAGEQGIYDISDDIAPYNGTIGADSPVYGLKIAMEDLDETFTFNDTERVEKRLDHAQLRIAEVTTHNSALLKSGGNLTSTGQLLLNVPLNNTGRN